MASRSASGGLMESTRAMSSSPLSVRMPATPSSSTRIHRPRRRARSRSCPARLPETSTTVTPSSPSSARIRSAPVTPTPSTTTTRWARPGTVAALGEKAARSDISEPSIDSAPASENSVSRTRPPPSVYTGCWWWGSHLSHSHARRASPSLAATATRTRSGPCDTTSPASIARTAERTVSTSPSRDSAANARSSSATGRSSTTECTRTKRRMLTTETGSRSSTGPVSGALSGVASACRPGPRRTVRSSGSSRSRSHIRAVPTIAGNSTGSGWRHSAALRCAAAVSRTVSRVCPR